MKSLIKLFLSSLLLYSYSSPVLANSVLKDIQETSLLKVAIREDAVPFGYRDFNGELSGFCLSLVQIIREEIVKTLASEMSNSSQQPIISIRLYKSNLSNRYDLVEDRSVHLECGPNTIRTFNRERNIEFSKPFFITGTQLLVKTENLSKVNLNGSLDNVTIGALRSTTNRRLIRDRYPQATLETFQGVTGRLRGLQALQQGRIDAFASDGILLIGEAVLLGLPLGTNFVLIPQNPLQCDYYGLILPNNDPDWKDLVNRSIDQAAKQGIFREWLGVILPEIENSLEYCRKVAENESSSSDNEAETSPE